MLHQKRRRHALCATKRKKKKEACNLIHNITPRLSMQIHSTLELRSSQYPQPAGGGGGGKQKTASSHALTSILSLLPAFLQPHQNDQLSVIYNPVPRHPASEIQRESIHSFHSVICVCPRCTGAPLTESLLRVQQRK